jgi:stage IV sporulation protein FB
MQRDRFSEMWDSSPKTAVPQEFYRQIPAGQGPPLHAAPLSRPCTDGRHGIPTARMIRFTLLGIPVEVQPFFWVTMVLLGGAHKANTSAAILELLLFVIAGFVSILTHEMGHALMARAFGAFSRITLQAFGGYATYTGVGMTRSRSFLITAAGPGIQFLLGALVLVPLIGFPNISDHGQFFLRMLALISFGWAVLNLLPVLPLDGGQMLNALLGPTRIRATLWISIIAAVAIAVAMYVGLPGFPIFPILLLVFAWQAFQMLKTQSWH